MSKLKGINVVLHLKTQSGTDGFNAPIYTETTENVADVIVGNVSTSETLENLDLYGKKVVYELGIPAGDSHNWLDTDVEFFGRTWHTFGQYKQCIVSNMPPAFRGRKNIYVMAIDEQS